MKIDKQLRAKIKRQILDGMHSVQEKEIIVKTPFKMTEDEMHSLKKSMPIYSKASITNIIDESIIGGMMIIDGSTIFDYSIKGKMSDVVDNLLAHSI